jgi:hypothetical protein
MVARGWEASARLGRGCRHPRAGGGSVAVAGDSWLGRGRAGPRHAWGTESGMRGDGAIDPSPRPTNRPPIEMRSLPAPTRLCPAHNWFPRTPAWDRARASVQVVHTFFSSRSAPHALTRLTRPWSSRLTPREPIPFWLSHFLDVAQSFYYIVSHFAAMNSTILVHWTKLFCCNGLIHFTSLNSVIFVIFVQAFLWFCYSEFSHFVILFTILLYRT